jgi:hypothetical protein
VSQWTHPICAACYEGLHPGRTPSRIVEALREAEVCCVCAEPTRDGIYFREDPNMLPAHHEHPDD